MDKRHEAIVQTAQKLTDLGVDSTSYILPDYDGYAPAIDASCSDIYCVEAFLGPSHNKKNYKSYAIAQIFDPRYPNLAFVTMVERREADGAPNLSEPPAYNPAIDRAFSNIFLPVMHSAFNELDPTGQNRSLLVQSYNARITLSDLPIATVVTLKLLSRFKKDGQLAQIAVDFADPLTKLVAQMVKPLSSVGGIHHIARVEQPSAIEIPLNNPAGGSPYRITTSSIVLDEGFAIARRYLDRHYETHHKQEAVHLQRGK